MKKIGCYGLSLICLLLGLWVSGIQLNAVNISDSPYGINVHLAADAVVAKANTAGIKWIRIDILWRDIEVNNLNYLYGSVDRVVNYAHRNGLSVLGVMAYSPTWTNSRKQANLPPDDVALWRRFVEKTVNRYKDRVKYWSIWNEPNLEQFFAAGKDVFVNRIFIPAAQTIKGVDPGAFIVGPDLAHKTSQGQEWYFWLKYILDNAGQYIDIIAHHIYNDQSIIYLFELLEKGDTLIPSVKQIIEESGYGSKPFWITETGWSTFSVSEEVQAERYLEFLQRMRQKGYPHKVFFYEVIDDPNVGVQPFGILRASRSEKPAYRVYRDFIAGVYPPLEDGDVPDDSKKCYAEESVSNQRDRLFQSSVLGQFRTMRSEVMRMIPQGELLVRQYYRHGTEFASLARRDSRLWRLGQKLLLDLQAAWSTQDRNHMAGLELQIDSSARELLSILREKNLSADFRRTLQWCAEQLLLIRMDGLDRYKGVRLLQQAKRFNDG